MSNNYTPKFSQLEVRFWDGEDWPERRISLGCKEDNGRAVMISPRFVELEEAEQDAIYIANIVNQHDELVESLRNAIRIIDFDGGTKHIDEARDLLAKIDAHANGEK
jgi:hypothetical protein